MARKSKVDLKAIDKIFHQTVAALRSGRDEIFGIAEAARTEYQRLQEQLEEIRQETAVYIREVDRLEKELRQARYHLAVVNKEFHRHSEEQIREAYTEVQELQVKLTVARERETALRRKRDEVERSLRNLESMVKKAEAMIKQVSAAMGLLAGNLEEALSQIEGLQERSVLATRIIQAQEDERKRVARDIHDGPAQSMANVVLRAEICEKLLDSDINELRKELAELKAMVKGSLVEIRRIIFNLRPMVLDDLGLAPTLRRFLEALKEETGVAAELVVLGKEQRLPGTVEVTVFRLIQEAVNNARKHARPGRILVRLEFTDTKVNLQVKDDGIGFDVEEAREKSSKNKSFGLLSMEERVDLLGGELHITSAPGKGTTVSAQIPLKQGEPCRFSDMPVK